MEYEAKEQARANYCERTNGRKEFEYFIEPSKLIEPDETIVMVGLSKNQLKQLPKNVIGITRTNNVQELAEIYTTADFFFNPTLEDNFPTANLEALACGTPVITFIPTLEMARNSD